MKTLGEACSFQRENPCLLPIKTLPTGPLELPPAGWKVNRYYERLFLIQAIPFILPCLLFMSIYGTPSRLPDDQANLLSPS
ncbi:unnamed protein product [Arctogadus glacialis]